MSNMSHCRFENTYRDLDECLDELRNEGVEEIEENANEYEKPYIRQLLELCREITDEFEHEIED